VRKLKGVLRSQVLITT